MPHTHMHTHESVSAALHALMKQICTIHPCSCATAPSLIAVMGMTFITLARTGLEPTVVETRAIDLLLAALKDFAACQGSVSSFLDLGQAHPFVYARPNGSLAVSLQLPP